MTRSRAPAVLLLTLLACGCGGASTAPVASSPPQEAEAATDKESLRTRHGKIFAELRALVDDLQASGRYDCCIKNPCSHCAMMVGGCSCGEGLRRGEPVCEECALMWMRGLGDETGVDPAIVRSFLEGERIINANVEAQTGSQTGAHSKHKGKGKGKGKGHRKHKAHAH